MWEILQNLKAGIREKWFYCVMTSNASIVVSVVILPLSESMIESSRILVSAIILPYQHRHFFLTFFHQLTRCLSLSVLLSMKWFW